MQVDKGKITGSLIITPRLFCDERGEFLETWQRDRYHDIGIENDFVQDMQSVSKRGVLRGLHYQIAHPQGHLVTVLDGRIFDVGVDLRPESPTFKQWMGVELSGEFRKQLWLPPGVAHGFCVLSDQASICYKCSEFFVPGDEAGIRWDDPDIAIRWPLDSPYVNERDKGFPKYSEITTDRLPKTSS